MRPPPGLTSWCPRGRGRRPGCLGSGGRKCSLPRAEMLGCAPVTPTWMGPSQRPGRHRRAVRSIGTAQTLQLICSKTLFFQPANGGDNTHLFLKGETRPYT